MSNERPEENQINILNMFKDNKSYLLSLITSPSSLEPEEHKKDDYIYLLTQMPVTKLSKFSDSEWDYNQDVLNPPKNVQGAKLKINFDNYSNLPDFVLIEIKCFLHYLNLNPKIFASGGKNKKNNSKIKPNTAISQFQSGLRFLNHVFNKINLEYGEEYVKSTCQTISDIQEQDFQLAAKDFPHCIDGAINKFFYYLKHPFAVEILNQEVQVDFDTLQWPERKENKREKRLVLDNDIFEKTMSHSTFRIVEFLDSMGEEVNDATSLSHFNKQKEKYSPLGLTPSLINDYKIIRLLTKGYSQQFINDICDIPREYLEEDNINLRNSRPLRDIVKEKHSIRHLDDIRLKINEVYYAAAYIVGQYTGMRPNALSEIRISSCLTNEDGYDLIVSEEKKGKSESYHLFDDKWVAIPIIKDAIKAVQIISQCKNNDYLFSNADTVHPDKKEDNMTSAGIKHMMNNYLNMLFDSETVKNIKFNPYMMRHTLAYQLYRAELGLPFISFQLKHLVERVGKYTSKGATSDVTLGYGEIADQIEKDTTKRETKSILRLAEIERVQSVMDPDATYLGKKGKEHKARLQKAFNGYMASGYTKEQVFEKMAEQGMALINVGSGFCYGGVEDFDEALPCIGTLRCNPIRCPNAIVTKANAPKWREIYMTNVALLGTEGYEDHESQLKEIIKESESVLEYLGEELVI